jgi:hypothetical protein
MSFLQPVTTGQTSNPIGNVGAPKQPVNQEATATAEKVKATFRSYSSARSDDESLSFSSASIDDVSLSFSSASIGDESISSYSSASSYEEPTPSPYPSYSSASSDDEPIPYYSSASSDDELTPSNSSVSSDDEFTPSNSSVSSDDELTEYQEAAKYEFYDSSSARNLAFDDLRAQGNLNPTFAEGLHYYMFDLPKSIGF